MVEVPDVAQEELVTPISPGTARKLGLRKPEPFATERFQEALTHLVEQLAACGFLGAVQAVGEVMHHFAGPSAERMATERWMRDNGVRQHWPGW